MSKQKAKKPLLQMLIDAGYPKEDVFHHYSDLYVYDTPLTRKVIKEWWLENGKPFFETFTDNVTGRKMFDIAFQYLPYWEEKQNELHKEDL